MKVLFLHGWQSVPGGVKPTYLKNHSHVVINPALDDDDFDAALATAQAEFDRHQPDVVVGSSRGGALAINLKSGNARLVLLCPAWKKWGTVKTVKPGTIILHSRDDDVVPFAHSEELAKSSDDIARQILDLTQWPGSFFSTESLPAPDQCILIGWFGGEPAVAAHGAGQPGAKGVDHETVV